MKIVIVSDTHRRHAQLGNLSGDVLIHCGDMEDLFTPDPRAIENIDRWFGRQDFAHILCIGGNHDFTLEEHARAGKNPFRNATLLTDSECIVDGVKFYGSPWVPDLRTHAFHADAAALDAAWSRIPDDVHVLITHTPPAGKLDQFGRGISYGCARLARRVRSVRPLLHCFGHVHAGAGQCVSRGVTYVNASCYTRDPAARMAPVEFHLTPERLRDRRAVLTRLLARLPF